jgi:NADH:ubiquinone oxidoreductase subunit E
MSQQTKPAAFQHIMVCINSRPASGQPSCARRGSEALAEHIEAQIQALDLDLTLQRTICFGHCQEGPTVRLAPGGPFLQFADVPTVDALLAQLVTDKRIANLLPGALKSREKK